MSLVKVEPVRQVCCRAMKADTEGPRQGSKQLVEQRTTSYYAGNIELGLGPGVFLYRLGGSRWVIDAQLFQQLSAQAHIKRAWVHQERYRALVVLTRIRLLAFTLLVVFYHRQVRSRGRWGRYGLRRLGRLPAYAWLIGPWDPG